MKKFEKILKDLTDELDQFDTFEDKHAFITSKRFGAKSRSFENFYNDYPGLQEEIHRYMLTSVIEQFGNPDARGYTFSKTVSDDEILDNVRKHQRNQELIGNIAEKYTGGTEDLNDNKIPDGIENLTGQYKVKEDRRTELTTMIDNIVMAIEDKRSYFDERSSGSVLWLGTTPKTLEPETSPYKSNYPMLEGFFTDPDRKKLQEHYKEFGEPNVRGLHQKAPWWVQIMPPLTLQMPLTWATKAVLQGGVGWLDWFKDAGLETIENRHLNYSNELGMSGKAYYGSEIAPLQSQLKPLYRERNNDLAYNYGDITEDYETYKELYKGQRSRKEVIRSTGFDEALMYWDNDEVLKILEKF